MSTHHYRGGHPDREALRALLQDALADLPSSDDPEGAARDVMRALDAYIEDGGGQLARQPREPPVTDFGRQQLALAQSDRKWTLWLVLGAAVVTTVTVVTLLSGGLPAAIAVAAIWIAAILALTIAS